MKKEFPDKWDYILKKLAYPIEYIEGLDDYQKPVRTLTKEDIFSWLKKACPTDDKLARTNENTIFLNFENGEDLTKLYLKSDVISLTCLFEDVKKVSISEFRINPPNSVSVPG